ncbi:MAG: 3-oxoacyl-ACP reductase FabG [Chloroflexi bacterium]|nr:3-oxoacyl-ACP reductase FabG [Chloroflexota bacterium]
MASLEMLNNKIAIVTGAGRGIGLEIGRTLAAAGASTVLVDIDGALAKQAAARLRDEGFDAIGLSADVRNVNQVRSVIDRTLAEWQQIDILVNNAGVCPITRVEEITVEEWELVLDVNLKGAFLFSQAVIPSMRRRQSGKIINIASSAGQMGGLVVGLHYSASKAGLIGLTKALARILAPHVQVNAVSPGTTESEMTRDWDAAVIDNIIGKTPAGRLGHPADIAAAVRFLASDEAGFITGQTLSVNGGLLMV